MEARRVLPANGLDLADHDAVVAEEHPRARGELDGDALVVGVADAERRACALRHLELRDRIKLERAVEAHADWDVWSMSRQKAQAHCWRFWAHDARPEPDEAEPESETF
jgi:hypothetical protein